MLPPSTVLTSAVVLSATAWCRKACATSSAVTSRAGGGCHLAKTTLIQSAWATAAKTAAISSRSSFVGAPDMARKNAIGALAASILTAACHMIKHGTRYLDLGPDHFDRRAKTVQTRRLITHLHKLGYAVRISPWRRDPGLVSF
jgi:transposase